MRALFDSYGVPEFGLLFCRDPPTGNPVLQPRVDVIEKFPVDASEYQAHHTFHLAVWKNSRGWISERNRTSCLVWIASSRLWFPRAFSNCTTLRIGSLHIFTAYAVHLTYLYNMFPASLNDSSQWFFTPGTFMDEWRSVWSWADPKAWWLHPEAQGGNSCDTVKPQRKLLQSDRFFHRLHQIAKVCFETLSTNIARCLADVQTSWMICFHNWQPCRSCFSRTASTSCASFAQLPDKGQLQIAESSSVESWPCII